MSSNSAATFSGSDKIFTISSNSSISFSSNSASFHTSSELFGNSVSSFSASKTAAPTPSVSIFLSNSSIHKINSNIEISTTMANAISYGIDAFSIRNSSNGFIAVTSNNINSKIKKIEVNRPITTLDRGIERSVRQVWIG
jgi:hypothetical protein